MGVNAMRDVLYRAKPLNLNKYRDPSKFQWVYGSPVINPFQGISVQIFEPRDGKMYNWECDPETLGQWTGLTDRNGEKIFEGDIVHCEDMRYSVERKFVGRIVYKNGSFAVNADGITRYRLIDYKMEVIGNIYDNSELLEKEEE